MSEISIRHGRLEDLHQLTEIYNHAIESGTSTGHLLPMKTEDRFEWFEQFDKDAYPIYTISKNDVIVGYGTLSPYRNGRQAMSRIAEISFFIHRDHMQKGYGSLLMDYMIEDCQRIGKEVLIAIILD